MKKRAQVLIIILVVLAIVLLLYFRPQITGEAVEGKSYTLQGENLALQEKDRVALDCTKLTTKDVPDVPENSPYRGWSARDLKWFVGSKFRDVFYPDIQQTATVTDFFCFLETTDIKKESVSPKCVNIRKEPGRLWGYWYYADEVEEGNGVLGLQTEGNIPAQKVDWVITDLGITPRTDGTREICYKGAVFTVQCTTPPGTAQAQITDYKDALAALAGPSSVTAAVVEEPTIQDKSIAYGIVMTYVVACYSCEEIDYRKCKSAPEKAWEMCIQNCPMIKQCYGPFWRRQCETHPDPKCIQSCGQPKQVECNGDVTSSMLFSEMPVCKIVTHEIKSTPTLTNPDFTTLTFSKPQEAVNFEKEQEAYAREQSEITQTQVRPGTEGSEQNINPEISGEPNFPTCHGVFINKTSACATFNEALTCNNRYVADGNIYYQCDYITAIDRCVMGDTCKKSTLA